VPVPPPAGDAFGGSTPVPPPGVPVPPPAGDAFGGSTPLPPVAPPPGAPAGFGGPPPGAAPMPPPVAPPPWAGPRPGGGAPVVPDPHGVGAAVGRLGGSGRRAGRVAVAVLAAVLGDGETVAVLAQGQFRGAAGVVALVGDQVVLVNDRSWKPDVARIPVDADLVVHGWQDDRSASLTFVAAGRQEVIEAIDRIPDRALAIELAQRIRHQTGAEPPAPAPPPPPPPPPPPG
jgi:hypothetical protein